MSEARRKSYAKTVIDDQPVQRGNRDDHPERRYPCTRIAIGIVSLLIRDHLKTSCAGREKTKPPRVPRVLAEYDNGRSLSW